MKKAIEYYEQVLAIAREIGDRQGEGNHLGNLGNAYIQMGDDETGLAYLLQAEAIFQSIGSPNVEAVKNAIDKMRKRLGDVQYRKLEKLVRDKLAPKD